MATVVRIGEQNVELLDPSTQDHMRQIWNKTIPIFATRFVFVTLAVLTARKRSGVHPHTRNDDSSWVNIVELNPLFLNEIGERQAFRDPYSHTVCTMNDREDTQIGTRLTRSLLTNAIRMYRSERTVHSSLRVPPFEVSTSRAAEFIPKIDTFLKSRPESSDIPGLVHRYTLTEHEQELWDVTPRKTVIFSRRGYALEGYVDQTNMIISTYRRPFKLSLDNTYEVVKTSHPSCTFLWNGAYEDEDEKKSGHVTMSRQYKNVRVERRMHESYLRSFSVT